MDVVISRSMGFGEQVRHSQSELWFRTICCLVIYRLSRSIVRYVSASFRPKGNVYYYMPVSKYRVVLYHSYASFTPTCACVEMLNCVRSSPLAAAPNFHECVEKS